MKKFLSAIIAMALMLAITPAVFAAEFKDVPDDAWYIHALRCSEDLGMVYGDGAGNFHPDEPVTVAQYITMLGRLFSDVEGNGYTPYLDWALRLKYIDSNILGVDNTITVEQFAVWLDDFMELTGIVPEHYWTDVAYVDRDDVSDYAKSSVDRMMSYSFLPVGEDSMLHPHNPVTRAECMVALASYAMSLQPIDGKQSYFEGY